MQGTHPPSIPKRLIIAAICIVVACSLLYSRTTLFARRGIPLGVLLIDYKDAYLRCGRILCLESFVPHTEMTSFVITKNATLINPRGIVPFFGSISNSRYRWLVERQDLYGHDVTLFILDERSGELIPIKSNTHYLGSLGRAVGFQHSDGSRWEEASYNNQTKQVTIVDKHSPKTKVVVDMPTHTITSLEISE